MLERFRFVFVFSIIALLIALPWYLRNWIMVDNPFFPFVFGGRYWDIFLDQWKTNNNSGIGWNFFEILIIPINIMRGNNDQNYYDSRIGPLFLLALPLLPIVFWKHRHAPDAKSVLFVSTGYMLIYYLFWTVGVINTINLWQTRYLWPALLIFAIPLGAGLAYLTELDTQHMRTSFIVYAIISFVIGITFLDNSLYLILRHPLSYAVGIETRREYFERIQPDYAAALELVDSTPRDSYVYFIFEPRSYSMTRKVQADAPNSNLMHDYYLYKTPNAIIKNWKVIGYTHVLVYIQGLETIKGKNGESLENYLDALVQNLKLESRRGSYNLYSIP